MTPHGALLLKHLISDTVETTRQTAIIERKRSAKIKLEFPHSPQFSGGEVQAHTDSLRK